MKFMTAASKAVLLVLLATAACLSAADTPTVTVKGYVLDSACALTSCPSGGTLGRRRVPRLRHASASRQCWNPLAPAELLRAYDSTFQFTVSEEFRRRTLPRC